MNNPQLDRLDRIALEVAQRNDRCIGPLSTGEALYVALAANREDLLYALGYTIAQALDRIDDEWITELRQRWRYRADPRRSQGHNEQ